MIVFPEFALNCLSTIKNNGYEAYFVGGCVRDALLGRNFDDIDITTNAKPEEITALFPHTVPTGIKHGTVTVIIDNKAVEVTTFRTEGKYTDARHPDKVNFVTDLSEDLKRRDFTINALAFDPEKGIIDLFDGVGDLKKRLIRAVGDPNTRFEEDALRILRAYRFSSVLGFDIEQSTKTASISLSEKIKNISGERILTELIKLSKGTPNDDFISFLNTGVLASFGIIGTKNSAEIFKKTHSLNCGNIEKFCIFVALTEHNTKEIKDKLKPSNDIVKLIEDLDRLIASGIRLRTKQEIKESFYSHSRKNTENYILYLSLFDEEILGKTRKLISEIDMNKEAYCLSQLDISGDDLKAVGFRGEEIGKCLTKAMNIVIKSPKLNNKESLLKIILG